MDVVGVMMVALVIASMQKAKPTAAAAAKEAAGPQSPEDAFVAEFDTRPEQAARQINELRQAQGASAAIAGTPQIMREALLPLLQKAQVPNAEEVLGEAIDSFAKASANLIRADAKWTSEVGPIPILPNRAGC